MELKWMRCGTDSRYCNLELLNLDSITAEIGVYVIWHGGENAHVVRVGQGNIADRLGKHRKDPEIMAYKDKGVFVTWAAVDPQHLDGVERFLADTWNPLVGDAFPDVLPIEVNSPFD